ncbi:hypothetical protein PULV_a1368 [Pseudoalteromonas ulvae UL12]|nr:hypothetical protein [Pseudoalteromonas ulvae UL12]
MIIKGKQPTRCVIGCNRRYTTISILIIALNRYFKQINNL